MAQQTIPAPVASLPPPPPIPESRIVTTDQIQKVCASLDFGICIFSNLDFELERHNADGACFDLVRKFSRYILMLVNR
jgi:hypothetical protein